jgi:hypothetical protein
MGSDYLPLFYEERFGSTNPPSDPPTVQGAYELIKSVPVRTYKSLGPALEPVLKVNGYTVRTKGEKWKGKQWLGPIEDLYWSNITDLSSQMWAALKNFSHRKLRDCTPKSYVKVLKSMDMLQAARKETPLPKYVDTTGIKLKGCPEVEDIETIGTSSASCVLPVTGLGSLEDIETIGTSSASSISPVGLGSLEDIETIGTSSASSVSPVGLGSLKKIETVGTSSASDEVDKVLDWQKTVKYGVEYLIKFKHKKDNEWFTAGGCEKYCPDEVEDFKATMISKNQVLLISSRKRTSLKPKKYGYVVLK